MSAEDRRGEATMEELSRVVAAVRSGDWLARIDVEELSGDGVDLGEQINTLLDLLATPLRRTAEHVEQIVEGKIPPRIEELGPGRIGKLGEHLNAWTEGARAFAEAGAVLKRMTVNDYTVGVEGQYQGSFGELAQGLNDVRTRMLSVQQFLEEMARGDLSRLELLRGLGNGRGKRSDNDRMAPAVAAAMTAIKTMVAETVALGDAAKSGDLGKRADPNRFEGSYRQVVEAMNDAFDALVLPLRMAAGNVNRIAKGETPPIIQEHYRGEVEKIKENLNHCSGIMGALVTQSNRVGEAVRDGDLTVRGQTERLPGTWAAIVTSMNGMAQTLQDALAQVSDAAAQLSTASTEIASSSQSVARGASEQASALAETRRQMDEISLRTQATTQNTLQAKGLADTGRKAAEKGTAAMSHMLTSMGEIRAASEHTAAIIREINEIAFQTNLLALNAAVEAARAGDAGRGFAVVAEEVRNLALRAKDAARKTDELISQSAALAATGQEVSQAASSGFSEIVTIVGKVSEVVSQIAASSSEQASGLSKMSAALAATDRVTQDNAANSEQSSSAAEQLAGQAQQLETLVHRFVLSRSSSVKTNGAPPSTAGRLGRQTS